MSILPSVLLLATHLLAVQVAGGGPLLAVALDLCGWRDPLLERLTRWSWYAFWLGLVLGLGLVVTQYLLVKREYADALEMLDYKLKWGLAELVVFAVSLWIYLSGWQWLRSSRWRRGWHVAIGLFSATNLLYHFPTLMLLFSRVVARRVDVVEPINAVTYREWAFGGDVFASTVHFWLASLVASGIALALLASEVGESSHDAERRRQRLGTRGATIALAAAMMQFPVGMWLMAALPGDDQSQLLGNDLWATGMLALAFLTAISLMHELSSLVFGAWNQSSLRRCAAKLCVVTVAMAGASLRLGM